MPLRSGARRGVAVAATAVLLALLCAQSAFAAEELCAEVLLTYPQLVLGADTSVPTVTGSVVLSVPAGTQSGQIFNLRGRGLPRVNSGGTGDLHVRVQLWTPDRLTEKEQQLIQELSTIQKSVPVDRGKSLWSKMRDALGA